MNKKLIKKIEEKNRLKDAEKICSVVKSGDPLVSKRCNHKDDGCKKCRSIAHLGCIHYKRLKKEGVI